MGTGRKGKGTGRKRVCGNWEREGLDSGTDWQRNRERPYQSRLNSPFMYMGGDITFHLPDLLSL